MMSLRKGKRGYLRRKKYLYIVVGTALFIVIGLLFFVLGGKEDGSAKIAKVCAVLTALPASYFVTLFVVMLPYKMTGTDEYEQVRDAVGEGIMITECAITSPSMKTVLLDYICVTDSGVIAASRNTYDNTDKYEEYIKGMLSANGIQTHVKIFTSFKDFIKRLKNVEIMSRKDADDKLLQAEGVLLNISI